MKAIYRGPTIVLIPETDNESDSLINNFHGGKFLMRPVLVDGKTISCFEFPVGTKETVVVMPNGSVQ